MGITTAIIVIGYIFSNSDSIWVQEAKEIKYIGPYVLLPFLSILLLSP